jgi:hypothetical protein
VHDEIAPRADDAQSLEPGEAINIIAEDSLAPVATRRYVIKSAREFESEWSGHSFTLVPTTMTRLTFHNSQAKNQT